LTDIEINYKELKKHFKDIHTVDDLDYQTVPFYVDSGNMVLNWILSEKFGGGYPAGRIIEIAADSDQGKTILGIKFLVGIQKLGGIAIFEDIEGTYAPDFGASLGLDNSRLITYKHRDKPTPVEEIRDKILKYIEIFGEKDVPIAILIDSLGALTTEHEMDKTETRDMSKAYQLNKLFRMCSPGCLKHNVTIVMLNHLYTDISGFRPKKISTGGGGVKYYSSIRLNVRRKAFEDKAIKLEIGSDLTVKCIKNNVSPTGRDGVFQIHYKHGIDKHSGLLETLKRLKMIEKMEGSYMWRFTTVDEEVKFRQTEPEVFKKLIEERPELLKVNY
jgi:recombination protein RecA